MRTFLALVLGVLLAVASPRLARALDPDRPVSEFTVTGWTMQDGLPHNLVHRVLQDREGFLWVGTWEGAARFNGRAFTRFDALSAAGPAIVGVRGLAIDDDGAMLFGSTHAGVRRLRADRWDALGGADAQRLKVTNLLRDRDGALWIGTEDALYRLEKDGRLSSIGESAGLQGNLIYGLLQVDDGDLLVGTSRGLFRVHEGRADALGRALGLPSSTMRSLVATRDGSLRVGGDGGVWRIEASLERAGHVLDDRVEAMLEDRHGVLWMSTTTNGLVRQRGDRFETIDERNGLQGRGSAALFEDREGLLWVGTTKGLFRVADGSVHALDRADGLSDDYVRSVLQAADGSMWIGHALGVDRWHEGKAQKIDLTALGHPASSVLSMARARDGGVWLGTYDQGVLHVAGTTTSGLPAQLDRRDGMPSNHVRSLAETRDGSLWIGTAEGLAVWRDGTLRRLTRDDGLPADFIRGLHVDRNGNLWIATSNGIARRAPDGSMRQWSGDAFPAVGSFDVLDDADGTVWVASDRGLLRLRGDAFSRYDHAAGLPSDTLFRILDDGLGKLWMSSNNGLYGVRRSELDEIDAGRRQVLDIDVVDHTDGMPSSQANGGSSPAGWRSDDGRLWFPTSGGVAVVDPARADQPDHTPVAVAFERLVVDGVPRVLDARHRLEAGTRRLAIDYAGLSLRSTRDVRYRYRMAGFDERWFDAGADTTAVFTNLPPGAFRFEVQASLHSQDWGAATQPAPAAMAFEIDAPFWQRTDFIAFATLACAGMLGMLHRWRLASLRRREQQLGAEIALRTRELEQKNSALEDVQSQHATLVRTLTHLAHHDALTGLPNRRAGEGDLLRRIAGARRGEGPVCVGLLDIDHFKRINDTHGHDAGDAVIKMVAETLRALHGNDVHATRHGGEEFLVAIGGDLDAARIWFERLRVRIATTPVNGVEGVDLHCTASIGIACWEVGHDLRSLLAQADRRLYLAKQAGRNRVIADDDGECGARAGVAGVGAPAHE